MNKNQKKVFTKGMDDGSISEHSGEERRQNIEN